MRAAIRAIEYHLPQQVLTNELLSTMFSQWSVEKIEKKTGIARRHIAAADECASDLAYAAALKLFASGACRAEEIDFILLCTQSPDYLLPTTACILQDKLGIPQTAGALDFNLGCSGFVYGLGLAKGLIETGQARNVLLLTAETYSKYIHDTDRSVRTLFGDAAAATLVSITSESETRLVNDALVENYESDSSLIGPFVYGTDGQGAENLIVSTGGGRNQRSVNGSGSIEIKSNGRTADNLYMNGPDVFNFTLRVVPPAVKQVLEHAGLTIDDVDLVVFHQANSYVLEHLRKKTEIPADKFWVSMQDYGNTVSSTIPIALKNAADAGKVRPGDLVLLVGFGVGYSWGATLVRWV
jgi:3-oxoacyl-[acyl-carrier-protein] synthase-3